MNKPLTIDYYTDILCVWAWIAQRRIEELNKELGDKITLRYHYIDIFGDVAKKMSVSWKDKGEYDGFAKHVNKAADRYDDAHINPKIWTEVRPTTSANAHLMVKAVELSFGHEKGAEAALMFRTSFYKDAEDISDINVLLNIVKRFGLDCDAINENINNGKAMAALLSDYQQAVKLNINGSPSYVMDGGRQILFGNVGYRIILTNIQELLKHPENEASWC